MFPLLGPIRHRFSFRACAVLLCRLSTRFGQTVVYQQPTSYVPPNGPVSGAAIDTYIPSVPTGVQAYDSFVPVASAAATSARWYGYYTGAGPGTDSWMIGFYADNSGAPGA